jgi:rSAM/selenodomain-associated transferase 1
VSDRDATVLVMAKSPRPGRVKTRLCPPCSPEHAAQIAAASLADTLETVAALAVRRRVLVIDGPVPPGVPDGFTVRAQVAGDLGARLAAAFASVDGPAFLVGMDTPQLQVSHLETALAHLTRAHTQTAVLGPAADGGWWGLGVNRRVPGLFAGVPMSAPDTGTRQLERLHHAGLRPVLLPVLRDVDEFDDALAVASTQPGSRFAAAVDAVARQVAPAGVAS